jgi:predicted nucleic acid-binding protein
MALPFLDTNIFVRHLRQDDPILSPKATAIFERIERGELQVRTSDTVVFETVFTLQRSYRQPRDRITEAVLALLELKGLVLPGKRAYRRVFALYRQGALGFADCYHVVLMERLGMTEILSFDTDFDRVPELTRREG